MESRYLYIQDERIKTFKNWPFSDNNKCNVKNMAEAGFYSVATGADDADAVKCFLCGKELDGWEKNDDPWEEHKIHASKCAFVQLRKKEDDMLLTEFLSVMKQYINNEIKRVSEFTKEQIRYKADAIRRRSLNRK